MSDLEEEMRFALFGTAKGQILAATPTPALPITEPKRHASWPVSPKLRVTLHVTKVFEGAVDVLVHDASTLSTIAAEMEAKAIARKLKYKYIDVISIKAVD